LQIYEILTTGRIPDTRNITLLTELLVCYDFGSLQGIELCLICLEYLGTFMVYPICSIAGRCMWVFRSSESPDYLWSPPSFLFSGCFPGGNTARAEADL